MRAAGSGSTRWPRRCGVPTVSRVRHRHWTPTSSGSGRPSSRTGVRGSRRRRSSATPVGTGSSRRPTRWTPCASPGWPATPPNSWPPDHRSGPCAAPRRHWRCGGGGPTARPPTRRGPGPPPRVWRSCTRRSVTPTSARCWPPAPPSGRWWRWRRHWRGTRCANGCGSTGWSRSGTADGAPTHCGPTARPATSSSGSWGSSPGRSCARCTRTFSTTPRPPRPCRCPARSRHPGGRPLRCTCPHPGTGSSGGTRTSTG